MNLQDAAYDAVALEQFKQITLEQFVSRLLDFRPLPRSYRSIWRVLHIDGFEERSIYFFHLSIPSQERDIYEEIAEES